MKKKCTEEVAGILKHYRKARPVSIEEMDKSLRNYFQQRAAKADRQAFRRILDDVPDESSVSGDEIIKND